MYVLLLRFDDQRVSTDPTISVCTLVTAVDDPLDLWVVFGLWKRWRGCLF